MRKVDIVVPVYKGLDETIACVDTVIKSIDRDLCNFIIINDCSPEPDLTQYLRDSSVLHDFILIENEHNLGFTGTANRGMTFHQDTDVILLNSDVEVVNDWVERIKAVAYLKPEIATVTPFSNNATICSFPNFCEDNELAVGVSVAEIDNVFSSLVTETKYVEIPTGVGFCMYMKREAINQVGLLDVETFGRGYGEENDWCQRAIQLGWKNVHALNTFVYHKGGVSFADEQNPRKENAMRLLNKLHPNYSSDVMNFIAKDPAKNARQEAEIALLAQSSVPKILIISHRLGGGVESHIRQLAHFYSESAKFIILQPAAESDKIELIFDGNQRSASRKFTLYQDDDLDALRTILTIIGVGHIHYHHLLGFNKNIVDVLSGIVSTYTVTVHDYYGINGNPTLCDKNGKFVTDDIAERDIKCSELYPVPFNWDIEQWRTFINNWFINADKVIFPSYDTFKRFACYYPSLADNSVVSWHPDEISSNPKSLDAYEPGEKLKILVLGALSREKGAEKLELVAKALQHENIEFYLLGYGYRPLDPAVICHGRYDHTNIDSKIKEISPHVIWFPAQWAETYSYTLSIALNYGVPIVVPDIGAFPERMDGYSFSRIVPWDATVDDFKELFKSLANHSPVMMTSPYHYPDKQKLSIILKHDFYHKHYLDNIATIKRMLTFDDKKFVADFIGKYEYRPEHNSHDAHSVKEKILVILWRLSQRSIVKKFIQLIPFKVQRAIKRFLSKRSLFDIIK